MIAFFKNFLLTRIFHTYHSEAMEKADGTRAAMNSDRSCMSTCRSDQTSSLAQYPSTLAKPQTERHEISGLRCEFRNVDFIYDQKILFTLYPLPFTLYLSVIASGLYLK